MASFETLHKDCDHHIGQCTVVGFTVLCDHNEIPARCVDCLNEYIGDEATLAEMEENQ